MRHDLGSNRIILPVAAALSVQSTMVMATPFDSREPEAAIRCLETYGVCPMRRKQLMTSASQLRSKRGHIALWRPPYGL